MASICEGCALKYSPISYALKMYWAKNSFLSVDHFSAKNEFTMSGSTTDASPQIHLHRIPCCFLNLERQPLEQMKLLAPRGSPKNLSFSCKIALLE